MGAERETKRKKRGPPSLGEQLEIIRSWWHQIKNMYIEESIQQAQ